MTGKERLSGEELGLLKRFSDEIVAAYNAHLGFEDIFQSKNVSSNNCFAFAENYHLLSPDQRKTLWQEAVTFNLPMTLSIQYQAAASMAKRGDLALYDELEAEVPLKDRSRHYHLSTKIAKGLLEIAIAQAKVGRDSTETMRYLKSILEQEMRVDDKQELLLSLATVAREAQQDPAPYLKDLIKLASSRDRDIESRANYKYFNYRASLINELASRRFTNEALAFYRDISNQGAAKDTLRYTFTNLSNALIEEGRFEEGLEFASRPKAVLLAKAAARAVELGQDPSDYMRQAETLLKTSPADKAAGVDVYRYLTKAVWLRGGKENPYFNQLAKIISEHDVAYEKVEELIKLLIVQNETIGVQEITVRQLLSSVEQAYIDLDEKADKLDRIESLMQAEEAVRVLIEIGLLKLAKKALGKIKVFYDDDDSGLEEYEGFALECKIKITLQEMKRAMTAEKISSLSKEEIARLVKINNPLLHRALGCFGVVSEELWQKLPPQARIAVLAGMNEREKKGSQILPNSVEIYSATKSTVTARALVESSDHKTTETLRQLLEDELKNGKDCQVIGRFLKGLIDADDPKGIEIATQLFMDETMPIHFRLYLARKLCDSGHWDRQIINYFQNYVKQGKRDAFMMEVKLDSLSAIVNQMHTTPSLALYKIFEQTRLSKDKKYLVEIAALGNIIFALPETCLKDKLEIFSFWAERYAVEELTRQDLERIGLCLQTLSNAEGVYRQRHHIDQRYPSIIAHLKLLYKNSEIAETVDELKLLLEEGIYPTAPLVLFAKNHGEKTGKLLGSLRDQTEEGFFNPNDLIQRDLEFTKYLLMVGSSDELRYEDFVNLEIPGNEEVVRKLDFKEKMEAEAAAYEACKLYWFIRERVEAGRKVTVVGNRRYGDYFVVEPLRDYLEDLGVQVSSYKIPSSGTGGSTVVEVFPLPFVEGLMKEKPDIVIVDGTKSLFDELGNARLPKSMCGYINWFHAFNEAAGLKIKQKDLSIVKEYRELVKKLKDLGPQTAYRISHYVPAARRSINIEDEIVELSVPAYGEPEVILANPLRKTIEEATPSRFGQHQPGYLDDPEQFVKEDEIIAFTKTGVKKIHKGRGTEEQFINSVLDHMTSVLPQMIRETNPSFPPLR